MLLQLLVEKSIRDRLRDVPLKIVLWNGHSFSLSSCPRVTLSVRSPSALRYLIRPTLSRIGEGYVEGAIGLEGSARDALEALEKLSAATQDSAPGSGPRRQRRWRPKQRTPREDARAVRYHYDVSNEYYRLWLDPELVYSCAYFASGDESLEQAQKQKLEHICRKLVLKPGERFLDIGCGWGALIRWAARNYGVRATGVTLSRNQYRHAREAIRAEGLEDRCEVLLCDYRELWGAGRFDKVASVGMFEHVGLKHLPEYFGEIRRLLRPGGLMLNHGICSSELEPVYVGGGGEFMERYVFPYTELPHMTRAASEMARQGFEIADVEALRPHYSLTLRHWLERLESQRPEAERIAGAKNYRIWRAYLAGAAHAFDKGWISIYQILASKEDGLGAWRMPWTREHLYQRAPSLAVQ